MKKIIFLFLLSISLLNVNAQNIDINSLLQSDDQELIKQAIAPALYVVESSYVVQDKESGQRFGLDGKSYFNQLSLLGVHIENTIVMNDRVLSPWEKDDTFAPYAEEYTPQLYQVKSYLLYDSVQYAIDSAKLISAPHASENYLLIASDNDGLEMDTTSGDKDGWIVYLNTNKKGERILRCMKKKIVIANSSSPQKVEIPQLLTSDFGGVFIIPKVKKIGQIEFRICGIISPVNSSNQLMLYPVSSSWQCSKKEVSTMKRADKKRLTLQNKNVRKIKNK